jgi:multidrug efflux pump subunit AcrA (membrane-fusion protein)
LPFILLCGAVVAIHELGHAFTLKHYGGIVPEIGLLFMCLSPGCYTNTTDSYCLTKRRQRILVVGAGMLCQLVLWTIGFWFWLLLTPGTWLKTGSYLFMVAALFTFAINLNPLAKFDGYYLAVAATGINNLRARSFLFYLNLIKRQPILETKRDGGILALYAPLSLAYSLLIFGHLIAWLVGWSLSNLPAFTCAVLLLWAIYYYFPSSGSSMTSATPSSPNSRPHVEPSIAQTASKGLSLPKTPTRAIWIGSIVLGIGAISLIPIPNNITGDASINSTPGARQVVTMPESGLVKAIRVKLNQQVVPGQIIAELSSSELDRQRLEVDRRLAEAISERDVAQQQLNLALGRQAEISTRVDASAQTAARMQQDLTSSNTPRIRQFQQQQTERQREITGLQTQLSIVNAQIERESVLVKEGALPLSRLDQPRREQAALQTQIAAAQAQIAQLDEQIATTTKDLRDELSDLRQPEVNAAIAALNSAGQEIGSMQVLIQKWERQIPLLLAEKQQLSDRAAQLTLKASVAGTITTADLDLLQGQRLPEGKEVLTISDAKQQTAMIELPQSDAYRVRVGMPVTFRLQDGDLQGFDATILEIPPAISPDNPQKPQQKPIVKVRIGFAAQTPEFTLGTQGYAHVRLGSIPLYQKVGYELQKLIPTGRFL